MIAAEKGHHECLSLLLAHGAEIDKADQVSAMSFQVMWMYLPPAIGSLY